MTYLGVSSASSESESGNDSVDDNINDNANSKETGGIIDQELNLEIFNVLEERKRYLINSIKPYSISNDINHTSQQIKTYIDYNNAHLIAQYLATKRPFSQSFDGYLKKIILVVKYVNFIIYVKCIK